MINSSLEPLNNSPTGAYPSDEAKSELRAFGIGCFQFGYDKPLPYRFDTTEYIRDVKQALGSLSSVGDVKVDFSEQFAYSGDVEGSPCSIRDGNFFPRLELLSLDFTVYIPARVTRDIFPHEDMDERVGTERFRVFLKHGFHTPIAVIECLNPNEKCTPSSAVRLMREYLKREFKKINGPVTFQSLGPSPFHADFYVREGHDNVEEGEVYIEETGGRGYAHFECRCGVAIPPEQWVSEVFDQIRWEIDTFYEFKCRYVKLLRAGQDLVEAWTTAQALVDKKVPWWNLLRRRQLHRAARDLAIQGYTLQARVDVDEKEMQHLLSKSYTKDEHRNLERFLNDCNMPSYPISSIVKWAERVEDGSFKQAEIQAVIVSALAGGMIGSVLTKLLT